MQAARETRKKVAGFFAAITLWLNSLTHLMQKLLHWDLIDLTWNCSSLAFLQGDGNWRCVVGGGGRGRMGGGSRGNLWDTIHNMTISNICIWSETFDSDSICSFHVYSDRPFLVCLCYLTKMHNVNQLQWLVEQDCVIILEPQIWDHLYGTLRLDTGGAVLKLNSLLHPYSGSPVL